MKLLMGFAIALASFGTTTSANPIFELGGSYRYGDLDNGNSVLETFEIFGSADVEIIPTFGAQFDVNLLQANRHYSSTFSYQKYTLHGYFEPAPDQKIGVFYMDRSSSVGQEYRDDPAWGVEGLFDLGPVDVEVRYGQFHELYATSGADFWKATLYTSVTPTVDIWAQYAYTHLGYGFYSEGTSVGADIYSFSPNSKLSVSLKYEYYVLFTGWADGVSANIGYTYRFGDRRDRLFSTVEPELVGNYFGT